MEKIKYLGIVTCLTSAFSLSACTQSLEDSGESSAQGAKATDRSAWETTLESWAKGCGFFALDKTASITRVPPKPTVVNTDGSGNNNLTADCALAKNYFAIEGVSKVGAKNAIMFWSRSRNFVDTDTARQQQLTDNKLPGQAAIVMINTKLAPNTNLSDLGKDWLDGKDFLGSTSSFTDNVFYQATNQGMNFSMKSRGQISTILADPLAQGLTLNSAWDDKTVGTTKDAQAYRKLIVSDLSTLSSDQINDPSVVVTRVKSYNYGQGYLIFALYIDRDPCAE